MKHADKKKIWQEYAEEGTKKMHVDNPNTKNGKGFAPGNIGGPGATPKNKAQSYKNCIYNTTPLETWVQICQKAIKQALAGDPKARDWLTNNLIPKWADLDNNQVDLIRSRLEMLLTDENN